MSEETSDNLDRLFDQYDAKAETAKAAAAQKSAGEKATRAKAVEALRSIVGPTFERLAQDINRRGHAAKLSERFDNFTYPGITLNFKPVSKDPNVGHLQDSTLEIGLASDVAGFKVTRRISGDGSGRARGIVDGRPTSISIEKLDAAWVEQQVLAFVRDVLNAS